jgi:hypothetical protein
MEVSSRWSGFSFQRSRQREERMLVRIESLIGRRRRMEERRQSGRWLIRSI